MGLWTWFLLRAKIKKHHGYLHCPQQRAPASVYDRQTGPRSPTQHIVDASLMYSWMGGKYNVSLECSNLADRLAYDNYMLQKPGRAFFVKFNIFLSQR